MIDEFITLFGSFNNTWNDLIISTFALIVIIFTIQSLLMFIASLFKR